MCSVMYFLTGVVFGFLRGACCLCWKTDRVGCVIFHASFTSFSNFLKKSNFLFLCAFLDSSEF